MLKVIIPNYTIFFNKFVKRDMKSEKRHEKIKFCRKYKHLT